jgi:hypothetical protein
MFFNLLGIAVVLGACGLAWQMGGTDERLTAAAFLIGTVASKLLDQGDYTHVQTSVLVIDLVILAGLFVLALRSDRFWPMWAAAFQLIGVTVHVASMTENGNFAWAYAVALLFWSYPVFFALAAGTWLEARYRRS